MKKHLSCTALAVLLLTGCSFRAPAPEDSAQTQTETAAAETQTTAETTTETTAETTASESKTEAKTAAASEAAPENSSGIGIPGDITLEDARKAAEAFFEAVQAGDAEKLFEISNYRDVLIVTTGEMTDEELLEYAAESCRDGAKSTFAIQEGTLKPEWVELFNEAVPMLLESFEADYDDESTARKAAAAKALLQPVDGIADFEIQTELDGEDYADHIMLTHADGKWQVSIMIAEAAVTYFDTPAAGSAAASLRMAAVSALTEMADLKMDVSLLNGKFEFTGSQFEDLTKPELPDEPEKMNTEDIIEYFMYETSLFFSDINKPKHIVLQLESGKCIAAALEMKTSDGTKFGYEPTDRAETQNPSSLDEALELALKAYENAQ